MPSGYRSIILAALIGLVAVSAGTGAYVTALNYPQEQGYQAYRYADHEARKAKASSGVDTTEYRTPCQQPEGHDESDLCAQWRAARAAEESAFWTKCGFWIAVIGSGLLLCQIALTRAAVEDTSEATEAMREANRIAKNMAKRQLRAYVTVMPPRINNHPYEGAMLDFTVTAKNNGVTPAKSLRWAYKFTVASGEGAEGELDLSWDDAERLRSIVGAGEDAQRSDALSTPITRECMGHLKNETARIWAVGEIRYEDIFGEKWSTKYRGYYDFNHGFVWDRHGNEAT